MESLQCSCGMRFAKGHALLATVLRGDTLIARKVHNTACAYFLFCFHPPLISTCGVRISHRVPCPHGVLLHTPTRLVLFNAYRSPYAAAFIDTRSLNSNTRRSQCMSAPYSSAFSAHWRCWWHWHPAPHSLPLSTLSLSPSLLCGDRRSPCG